MATAARVRKSEKVTWEDSSAARDPPTYASGMSSASGDLGVTASGVDSAAGALPSYASGASLDALTEASDLSPLPDGKASDVARRTTSSGLLDTFRGNLHGAFSRRRQGSMDTSDLQQGDMNRGTEADLSTLALHILGQYVGYRVVDKIRILLGQSASRKRVYADRARLRSKCRHVLQSPGFLVIFALMALTNAVAMGLQQDNIGGGSYQTVYARIEEVCITFFLVEVFALILIDGLTRWRALDAAVVLACWCDTFLLHDNRFRALAVFRLLMVVTRTTKLLRHSREFRSLRVIATTTPKAFRVFARIMLIWGTHIFVFAFTMRLLLNDVPPDHEVYEMVQKYFRSIPRAVIVMADVSMMGLHWTDQILYPLVNAGYATTWVLWLCFVASSQFIIVNLCAGVMISMVIKTGKEVNFYMENTPLLNDELWKDYIDLWVDIDEDNSGSLTLDEMKTQHRKLSQRIGVNRDHVELFFDHIDLNGDGRVRFEEFTLGVISWLGLPRNVNTVGVEYKTQRICREQVVTQRALDSANEMLTDVEWQMSDHSKQTVEAKKMLMPLSMRRVSGGRRPSLRGRHDPGAEAPQTVSEQLQRMGDLAERVNAIGTQHEKTLGKVRSIYHLDKQVLQAISESDQQEMTALLQGMHRQLHEVEQATHEHNEALESALKDLGLAAGRRPAVPTRDRAWKAWPLALSRD